MCEEFKFLLLFFEFFSFFAEAFLLLAFHFFCFEEFALAFDFFALFAELFEFFLMFSAEFKLFEFPFLTFEFLTLADEFFFSFTFDFFHTEAFFLDFPLTFCFFRGLTLILHFFNLFAFLHEAAVFLFRFHLEALEFLFFLEFPFQGFPLSPDAFFGFAFHLLDFLELEFFPGRRDGAFKIHFGGRGVVILQIVLLRDRHRSLSDGAESIHNGCRHHGGGSYVA